VTFRRYQSKTGARDFAPTAPRSTVGKQPKSDKNQSVGHKSGREIDAPGRRCSACVSAESPYNPRIPSIGRELNGRLLHYSQEAAGPDGPVVPCFRLQSDRAFPKGSKGLAPNEGPTEEGHFMPLYEHVYLARQDVSSQQVEDLTKQFTTVIEGLGGKVTKNEYWGVKTLNFRINKNRKAHFTLLNVDAPPAAIVEVERQQRINEDVLRYLTVRVEELEEGPSAMMRKVDRDRERDDRGFGDRGGFGGGGGGRFGDRDRGDRFGGDRGGGGFGGDRGDRPPRRDREERTTTEEPAAGE
jgi:small subunit ribosomal protein S6